MDNKYVGSLPTTIFAQSGELDNYRIYGTKNGAGLETESGEPAGFKIPILNTSGVTENLVSEIRTVNGWRPGYLKDGSYISSQYRGEWLSPFIDVGSMTSVSIVYKSLPSVASPSLTISFFDINDEYLSSQTSLNNGGDTFNNFPLGTAKICYAFRTYCDTEQDLIQAEMWTMLIKGSTPPDHYIPHRYELNYDLFIGDSKLGEEEYLDYGEQKIYKMPNVFDGTISKWPSLGASVTITDNGDDSYTINNQGNSNYPSIQFMGGGLTQGKTYRASITISGLTTQMITQNHISLGMRNTRTDAFISGTSKKITSDGKWTTNFVTVTDGETAFCLIFSFDNIQFSNVIISDISIVEIMPTDPPVPFPAIQTYKDENTISSTEAIAKAQFNWTIMEVDSLKMPDNTYYDFKDTQGRAQLSEIQSWIDSQESSISTTKVGLQVDYQNKTNTRLNIPTIDPNTGLPFTFDSLSIYSNRRRCNVNDAGEITAWYGDEDYKEDGSNGQVMVYQPKFYYRVEPVRLEEQSDGLGYHIRCANYWISETPLTGFRVHPAFINEDGNEVDYYLTGAYEASIYDTSESTYLTNDEQVASFANDLLCSIANVKPASGLTQGLTRANCELMAKNRGNVGWHNTTVQIESAEQLLMMIELGTMNFQNAIGAGVTNMSDNSSYNCSALTGSTSILGNVSGRATSSIITKGDSSTTYTANGYVSISYRGRENPYGNIWKFVEGMIIAGRGESKGGIPFICNDFAFPETSSTTAGSGTHDFTLNGYTSAGFTITNAAGYISAMGYGDELYDWLFVASECSGNSTNPVGDYTYPNANLNGVRVALLGGRWNYGTAAGSFYCTLYRALTDRSRYLGGRAVLIPRKLTHAILT